MLAGGGAFLKGLDELIYKESSSGKMLINNDNFKEILEKFKKDKPES